MFACTLYAHCTLLGGTISEGDIVKSAHPKSVDSGDLWPDGVIPYTYHPCEMMTYVIAAGLIVFELKRSTTSTSS